MRTARLERMGPRHVAGRRLGALEAELLDLLWAADEPLGARELAAALSGKARAYTTVVTVLTRLVEKGLVARVGDGRRFRYYPAGEPDALTAKAISELLDAAQDRHAVLAHLISDAADPQLRAELAALLEQAGDTS
jgi:predicted transcriptional regulator